MINMVLITKMIYRKIVTEKADKIINKRNTSNVDFRLLAIISVSQFNNRSVWKANW